MRRVGGTQLFAAVRLLRELRDWAGASSFATGVFPPDFLISCCKARLISHTWPTQ